MLRSGQSRLSAAQAVGFAITALVCSSGASFAAISAADPPATPPAQTSSAETPSAPAAATPVPATTATPQPAQQPQSASAEATAAAAVQAAPATAEANDEAAAFNTFRHDLINLLILRADGRTLAAAAQIAAPDADDPTRLAVKKTPGLLQRALRFGEQDPLVLWVASSNVCQTSPSCADANALSKLQTVDADNAAAWLRSFPADDNAARATAIVARMAQAQRYDDYWGANVVALVHALEVLPVPASVTRQGVGVDAARINFATSIASSLLPTQLKQLAVFCRAAAGKDAALISDCISVARKLETGGTFISQKVGFAIEEALVAPGVDRDIMHARERSAAWQQEQFLALSAKFSREPAVAKSYVRLLTSEKNELAANLVLLREQSIHSDPPAGWEPPSAPVAGDPMQSAPAVQH